MRYNFFKPKMTAAVAAGADDDAEDKEAVDVKRFSKFHRMKSKLGFSSLID